MSKEISNNVKNSHIILSDSFSFESLWCLSYRYCIYFLYSISSKKMSLCKQILPSKHVHAIFYLCHICTILPSTAALQSTNEYHNLMNNINPHTKTFATSLNIYLLHDLIKKIVNMLSHILMKFVKAFSKSNAFTVYGFR